MRLGKVAGVPSAAAQPSPSPMASSAGGAGIRKREEGGVGAKLGSIAAQEISESQAKVARLEEMVARLQKQGSEKSLEAAGLLAEKKQLQVCGSGASIQSNIYLPRAALSPELCLLIRPLPRPKWH